MKLKCISEILNMYGENKSFFIAQFEGHTLNKKPVRLKPRKVTLSTIEQPIKMRVIALHSEYDDIKLLDFDYNRFIVGDTLEEVQSKYDELKNKWIKKRIDYLERSHENEINVLKSQIKQAV